MNGGGGGGSLAGHFSSSLQDMLQTIAFTKAQPPPPAIPPGKPPNIEDPYPMPLQIHWYLTLHFTRHRFNPVLVVGDRNAQSPEPQMALSFDS